MAGRTPALAADAFLEPLQRAVSCITRDILITSPGGKHVAGKVHSLTLSNGPIVVADTFELDLAMKYEIVRVTEPEQQHLGPWKVKTHAYDYLLRDEKDKAVAWHWHPGRDEGFPTPHMHVWRGPVSHKTHLASGRVAMEEVVRTCIIDLGTPPLRSDWDATLLASEGPFRLYRTWP